MTPILNAARVREVLQLRGRLTSRQIARRFGIGVREVDQIFTGARWAHVHSDIQDKPTDAAAALFRRLHVTSKDWLVVAIEAVRAVATEAAKRRHEHTRACVGGARGRERVCALEEDAGEFTTDDVRARLERLYGAGDPRGAGGALNGCDPRILGAAMTLARGEGICSPTDQYRTSERKICKGRPVRVWRSEL